jgi:signal transduction histidine kinase
MKVLLAMDSARIARHLEAGIRNARRMQNRLEETELLLVQAQKMSETEGWRWDIETGEITPVGQAGALFGHLADAGRNTTIDDLFEALHPDDSSRVSATFTAAMAGGQNIDVRFRIVEEGAVRYFRGVGERRRCEGGGAHYLCSCMDVTAQEQREDASRHADAEIAHLARVYTLGKLTSSIVHEVNQPLSAILTYSTAALQWLHRDEPEIAEASVAMESIIRDATRAREVVARIRRLSKNGLPHNDAFDIAEIIEETSGLLARDLQARHIVMEFAIAGALPGVSGDRVQIQQVLINLMLNAMESLEAVHTRTRVITVAAERMNANRLRLVVRDNGPGVAAEARERLFEPFFSTREAGLGMGLAICRTIVEAHNGSLTLSACEEPGAAFELVLPVMQAS